MDNLIEQSTCAYMCFNIILVGTNCLDTFAIFSWSNTTKENIEYPQCEDITFNSYYECTPKFTKMKWIQICVCFCFFYFNCVFIFCLSINFHKTYTYRIRVSGASPEKAKNHPFMAVRLCCPKYFIVNVLFFNYGWGGLAELSFEQLPNYFGSCLCLLNGIESIRLLFLCNKHSNVNCVCSLVTSQQRIKRKM